jgi:hypothetical protein
MGYKTWFHRLKESENPESPYHGNAALMAGAGKLGGGPTIDAGNLDKDEPVAPVTNNYFSDPNEEDTAPEETLDIQIATLNKQLDKETDEEKRKELLKKIDELTKKKAEQDAKTEE